MMIAHKLTRFCLILATVFASVGVPTDADARRQRLRLTTIAPKDSSFHKSLLRMGRDWKIATSGQVELIVFPGGVQGGETAMLERIRVNQTQAALISGVGLAEIDDAVAGLQQIPMMFRSYEELEHVMSAMAPKLERRMKSKGFIVLSWIDSGWVRIFSKKELATPEDMKTGKLFTWAGDTKQTDLLKDMGFRPVPIDSTEISSSLQTGLIDIVPMPPFFALASQSYKPASYMLDLHYTPLVGAIVVSEKIWGRIAPAHQEAMVRSAKKFGREMTLAGREENEEAIRVMREKWGLRVRSVDKNILQAWNDASEQAYWLIRDNTVPAEIFDEVVHLLDTKRSAE